MSCFRVSNSSGGRSGIGLNLGLLVGLSPVVDLRASDIPGEAVVSRVEGTKAVGVARRCGGLRGVVDCVRGLGMRRGLGRRLDTVVRVRGLGVRLGLGRRGMALVVAVLRLVEVMMV